MDHPKPLIMCIEDEDRWQRHFQRILGAEYEIAFAKSIAEAEQIVQARLPGLLLVDISLIPDEPENRDGFAFLDSLLQSGALRELPVVIVSAYGRLPEAVTAFTQFRVRQFLSKGDLDPDQLRQVVQENIVHRQTGPARALVIEDDSRWQKRLITLLEKEGCMVEVAASYAEASRKVLAQPANEPYHLMTVDLRLNDEEAGEEGFDLLQSLHHFDHPVPSLIVSAYGTPEQLSQAYREFDVRDYLYKGSFNPEVLRARVREIIDSEFYVIASIETDDADGLLVNGRYTLLIRSQRSAPLQLPALGDARALSRPLTNVDWPIDVIVNSPDLTMQVLPRSYQQLVVRADFDSEPLAYKIMPLEAGSGKLEIEFHRPGRFATWLTFNLTARPE